MTSLVRLALRAWPADLRGRDGALLADTAAQMIEDGDSTGPREARAIATAGLSARAARRVDRIAGAAWSAAARVLLVPLSVVALVVLLGTLVRGTDIAPVREAWITTPGVGDLVPIALLATALAGAVLRRHGLVAAAAGAALLAVLGRIAFLEAGHGSSGPMAFLLGSAFEHYVPVLPALLPVLVLLLAAAIVAVRTATLPADVARPGPGAVAESQGGALDTVTHEPPGRRRGARSATLRRGAFAAAAVVAPVLLAVLLVRGDLGQVPEGWWGAQLPSMALLWAAPVLAFVAARAVRAPRGVRLATVLTLAIPGPVLAWLLLAAVSPGVPDPIAWVLLIALQLVWLVPTGLGVRAAVRGGRA